jgi:hypothetical protein
VSWTPTCPTNYGCAAPHGVSAGTPGGVAVPTPGASSSRAGSDTVNSGLCTECARLPALARAGATAFAPRANPSTFSPEPTTPLGPRFPGPATYLRQEGDRPMAITWGWRPQPGCILTTVATAARVGAVRHHRSTSGCCAPPPQRETRSASLTTSARLASSVCKARTPT